MKRRIAIILLVASFLTLSACALWGMGEGSDETEKRPMSDAAALAAAEQKAAYYQERVTALEAEMLSLKATFREERTAYEARIAALEAALDPDTPTLSPSDFPFTYKEENGGITVTGFRGGVQDLTIPASIAGKPVLAIADRAFENAHELRSVTLPEGLITVGWFSFGGCISLEKAIIPATVTNIRYGAFQNCPASLVIVTPLGSYADAWARSYGIGVENGG